MVSNEPVAQPSVGTACRTVLTGTLDVDFNARWVAWVARGRAHEQRARRKFVVWAGVLAIGAAIVSEFMR